jgi:hypothetical protein
MKKITIQMIVNGNPRWEQDIATTSFINITRINVVIDEKDYDNLLSHKQRYYVEMSL